MATYDFDYTAARRIAGTTDQDLLILRTRDLAGTAYFAEAYFNGTDLIFVNRIDPTRSLTIAGQTGPNAIETVRFVAQDGSYNTYDAFLATPSEDITSRTGVYFVAGTLNADTIRLNDGGSEAYSSAGADRVFGGTGADWIVGGRAGDTIEGGAGDDRIYGDETSDDYATRVASRGNDRISAGAGADIVYGGGGNDTISGGDGDDVIFGGSGNDIIDDGAGDDTIDGGSGIDTLSRDYTFSTSSMSLVIDLDAGETSSPNFPDAQPDILISIENLLVRGAANFTLIGSNVANTLASAGGADLLIGAGGNDILRAAQGFDTLRGGDGDDSLDGGLGRDRLTGGTGADVFVFRSISETGVTLGTRDVITDFRSGTDDIDLRLIDANTNLGATGDQSFSFIGSAAFTGIAGQLRFADGLLSGDVNGDRIADFQIALLNVVSLEATDFIL